VGGTIGFDGLLLIKPDGRIVFQSGIGNLGTESMSDVHRAGAEVLGVPWEKCDVVWGSTTKNLPWSCVSGGSQTTHSMTRAAHAAAMDARKKLQEIAAKTLGGKPEDYEVANERVFRKGGGGSLTLAQAAERAIELGGIYDGHEAPAEVNKMTKASVAALAGQGLVAAAKDQYPRDGMTHSFVASFAELEVDVETGKYYIVDFLAYADVGTVIHPRALGGQVLGRSTLGIGHAIGLQTLPPQQAPNDSGCPREHAVGSSGYSRSGDACGRAWHRRAAGWGRMRLDPQRPFGRARGRNLPTRARQRGHYPGRARSGTPHATPTHGAHLGWPMPGRRLWRLYET
jgi:hypothetical protein